MYRLHMVAACCLIILSASPLMASEILLTIPQPPPGYYSQYFGRSVANVGDHNGDGYDDFLVGQPGHNQSGGSTVGYAHFFHGGPFTDPLPEFTFQGPSWDSRLGWSVTELGDFNADSQPDFAVSRPGGEVSGVNVYWGGEALDQGIDLSLTNNQSYSWFGGKISGGHDFNGDGHPDLAVAATRDDSGPGQGGRVYLYHGGPAPDQQADLILDAPFPVTGFGYNLQLTGDVTGDGWADLLVLNWDPHQLLIYAGGPDSDALPDLQLDLPDQIGFPNYSYPDQIIPQVEAGDLDGDGQREIVIGLPLDPVGGQVWVLQAGPDQDFASVSVIYTRRPEECFGRMIDVSGDFDGDGIVDLLVGSRGPHPSHLSGYLFVYPGGDLDNLNLSLVMTDETGNRRFGASAVSLGDLDGDEDDELLVGSVSPYGYVWIVDEMFFDCDDDDVPDWQQGAEDCDGDQVPDVCQVVLWPEEDCNTNGIVDSCEITQDPGIDCDGNGLIDSCEIEADADLDCNQNNVLDSCELAANPSLDCDGDGILDACALAADPGLDCNLNEVLDSCEVAADPSLDCDNDGVFDACQIADDHLLDYDEDGVLDYCQFPGTLSLFADPEFTSNNLTATEPGLIGPFYLVLNVPLDAAPVTHVELDLTWSAGLFGLQVLTGPAIAYDADTTNGGLVLSFGEPMIPDGNGNLLVAQVWGILQDPETTGHQIRISGNTSAASIADFSVPLWTDATGQFRFVTETSAGYINQDLSDTPEVLPRFRLALGNHPNPFNPSTTIQMEFPGVGVAKLEILDLSGRIIQEFAISVSAAGPQELQWRGTDRQGRQVASGVYLARLAQGALTVQSKLVLLR